MLSSLRLFSVFSNQTLATSFARFPVLLPRRRLWHHQQTPSAISSPENHLFGFINGDSKVIEIAHSFWHQFVQKGDTVVDATCGNGHDTVALVNMVSSTGSVYAIDLQKCAIQNTTDLLNLSFPANDNDNLKMRDTVKLFQICHSRMKDIVPHHTFVRLVVFNLGYLPGGDKSIITVPDTTLEALKAAATLVGSGGVISVMLYVGHPGGRQEYEAVLAFASALPAHAWVCSKFEMLNRPLSPVLVFIFRK